MKKIKISFYILREVVLKSFTCNNFIVETNEVWHESLVTTNVCFLLRVSPFLQWRKTCLISIVSGLAKKNFSTNIIKLFEQMTSAADI